MLNIVHYLVLQKQKKQNNLNLFVNIVVNSLLDIMLQLNIVRCLVNKNIIELNKRLTTQKIWNIITKYLNIFLVNYAVEIKVQEIYIIL